MNLKQLRRDRQNLYAASESVGATLLSLRETTNTTAMTLAARLEVTRDRIEDDIDELQNQIDMLERLAS